MNLKVRGGYMVRWGGGGVGIVRFLGCCFEKNVYVESFEVGENVWSGYWVVGREDGERGVVW